MASEAHGGSISAIRRQLSKLEELAQDETGAWAPVGPIAWTALRRATQVALDLALALAPPDAGASRPPGEVFLELARRGVLEPGLAGRLRAWVESRGVAAETALARDDAAFDELALPVGADLDAFARSVELGRVAPAGTWPGAVPDAAIRARRATRGAARAAASPQPVVPAPVNPPPRRATLVEVLGRRVSVESVALTSWRVCVDGVAVAMKFHETKVTSTNADTYVNDVRPDGPADSFPLELDPSLGELEVGPRSDGGAQVTWMWGGLSAVMHNTAIYDTARLALTFPPGFASVAVYLSRHVDMSS